MIQKHVPALYFLGLAAMLVGNPSLGQTTYTTILQTGENVPALGGAVGSFNLSPRINAGGGVAVAVSVSASATRAVLQGGASNWRLAVKSGQSTPGVAGSIIAILNSVPLIESDQGYILCTGIEGPNIDTWRKDCLWAEEAGGLKLVAISDGTPTNGIDMRWTSDVSVAADKVFSNDSEVGMSVNVTLPGNASSGGDSLWVGPPTSLQFLARRLQAPIGVPNFFTAGGQPTRGWSSFSQLRLGTSGHLAFFGQVAVNATSVFYGEGVWERPGLNELAVLYYEPEIVPVPNGGTPYSIRLAGAGGNGPVLVFQSVNSSAGNGGALFANVDGPLAFAFGWPAPVTGLPDLRVNAIPDYSVMSGSGRIAALVTAPSTDQLRTNGQNIIKLEGYTMVTGQGGNFSALAVNNAQTPGLPAGVKFKLNGDDSILSNDAYKPAMTPLGRLMFITKLQGTGVGTTNNKALWLSQPAGSLDLVLRTGQIISTPTGNRTVSDFFVTTGSSGDDGLPRGHNDAGQVAIWITFTTGPHVIAIASTGATVPIVTVQHPVLAVGRGPAANQVTLSWTTAEGGWIPQQKSSLVPAFWQTVPGTPVQNGQAFSITLTPATTPMFFRLQRGTGARLSNLLSKQGRKGQ